MIRREVFDDAALVRAIGQRAPPALDREGRVRMLAEAAQALLDGRAPSREAALFVGGGLLSWLREGGSLTKHFWKVDGPRGSHSTAAALWSRHRDERQLEEGGLGSAAQRPGDPKK